MIQRKDGFRSLQQIDLKDILLVLLILGLFPVNTVHGRQSETSEVAPTPEKIFLKPHPFFNKTVIERGFNLDKDILEIDLGGSFAMGDTYFNKKQVLRNINLRSYEANTIFRLLYGLSDNFSFGFSFPIGYQRMEDVSDTPTMPTLSAYGLADVVFSSFYQLFSIEDPFTTAALFLEVKLPSANTYIGTSTDPSIPLGNGQQEYTLGAAFKHRFFDPYAVLLKAGYTMKEKALAEYLQVQSEVLPGTPVGNKTIDFGDEYTFGLLNQFQFADWFGLDLGIHFTQRKITLIDGIAVEKMNDADSINSRALLGIDGSDGWFARGMAEFVLSFSKRCDLSISNRIPIAGNNYPIVQMALVDGLIGYIDAELSVRFFFE